MKKRKAVSQLLKETEKEHEKLFDYPIEVGDLGKEIGKKYMQKLREAIENHRKYEKDILWFIVKVEKEPWNIRAIKITFGVVDKPLKFMRERMDLWKYDYKKEELSVCWSLPHHLEMRNFLNNPWNYPKQLIQWINQYLKQENIDLTKEKILKIKL